jgi:CheY-like chemotaxis protein
MKTPADLNPETNQHSWLERLFRALFKSKEETAPAPAHRDSADSNPELFRRKATVLVVDDDTLFLKRTRHQLEAGGYSVITAANGEEAIQKVRQRTPEAIVLDVNLPQDFSGVPWNGYRITAWLQRFEQWKTIPIVVTSGGDPSQCTRTALEAGATAFFHKRMAPEHLLTLVKHALQRKKNSTTRAEQAARRPLEKKPNFEI